MNASLTLSASIEKFLAWSAVKFKPATVKWYRHFLQRFAALHPEKTVDAIKRIDVELWSAKHHELTSVCRFFQWAFAVAELIDRNPCKGIRVPKNGRRTRVLERTERVRIRRVAPAHLRLAVLAMELTGCRPHEMRRMAWEQIRTLNGAPFSGESLEAGDCFFVLWNYKGKDRRTDQGRPRIIAIPKRLGRTLARLLRRCEVRRGSCFTMTNGAPWSANAFRCAWRRARAKLRRVGLVDVVGLVPYLLRHTFATSLALEGINAQILADMLGHSGLDMLSVYVHSIPGDLVRVAKNRNPRC